MTATARKQHPSKAGRATAPEDVLAQAQADRAILQDFVPLADSLEWQLGQEYLRQRGNKAFLADAHPVPFVVDNDGARSHNAADILFASLAPADHSGTLQPGTEGQLQPGGVPRPVRPPLRHAHLRPRRPQPRGDGVNQFPEGCPAAPAVGRGRRRPDPALPQRLPRGVAHVGGGLAERCLIRRNYLN